jgi:hypothetical protein
LEAKAIGLARDLTGFEAWPRHSDLAAARLEQLAEPGNRLAENPPAASEPQAKPGKHVKRPGRGKSKAKARHKR